MLINDLLCLRNRPGEDLPGGRAELLRGELHQRHQVVGELNKIKKLLYFDIHGAV